MEPTALAHQTLPAHRWCTGYQTAIRECLCHKKYIILRRKVSYTGTQNKTKPYWWKKNSTNIYQVPCWVFPQMALHLAFTIIPRDRWFMPVFQIKKPWDEDVNLPKTQMTCNRHSLQLRVYLTSHWWCHVCLLNTQMFLFQVAHSKPAWVTWVFYLCNCLWEPPKDGTGWAKFVSEDKEKQRFCYDKILKIFSLGLTLLHGQKQQDWVGVHFSPVEPRGVLRWGLARNRIFRRMNLELNPACSASL